MFRLGVSVLLLTIARLIYARIYRARGKPEREKPGRFVVDADAEFSRIIG